MRNLLGVKRGTEFKLQMRRKVKMHELESEPLHHYPSTSFHKFGATLEQHSPSISFGRLIEDTEV
jgi:hypothetical protein